MTDIHLVVDGLSLCNVTGEGGLPPSMYREITCERCRESTAYELCVAMEWLRNHDYDIPEFPQITIPEAMFVLDTYEAYLPEHKRPKHELLTQPVKVAPNYL